MDWINVSIIEDNNVAHIQTIWKGDFIPHRLTVRGTEHSNADEMGA
jgi:hypothetical protein